MNIKKNSMVYFITDGTAFKIGSSNNPEKRMAALQTANPRKLEMYRKIEGGVHSERFFQDFLSDKKVLNEWFDISKQEVDFSIIYLEDIREFYISFENATNISHENINTIDRAILIAVMCKFNNEYDFNRFREENMEKSLFRYFFPDAFNLAISKFIENRFIVPCDKENFYRLDPYRINKFFNEKKDKKSNG